MQAVLYNARKGCFWKLRGSFPISAFGTACGAVQRRRQVSGKMVPGQKDCDFISWYLRESDLFGQGRAVLWGGSCGGTGKRG